MGTLRVAAAARGAVPTVAASPAAFRQFRASAPAPPAPFWHLRTDRGGDSFSGLARRVEMRRLALAMLAAVLLACGPMKADDNAAKIHGVWKLTSYKVQIVGESGPPRNVFGADPKGYVVFTPEARMMLLVTAANRKPATNDGETAALFKTMAAFSGRYAVDAEKIVTMPDVSWNEIYA